MSPATQIDFLCIRKRIINQGQATISYLFNNEVPEGLSGIVKGLV